ncbi:MAG TPA: hypothetical protein VMW10_08370 [Alphaproteobacteria bacterium]|nr:hypothetical protein [Alphaproteobacteria bacterium]
MNSKPLKTDRAYKSLCTEFYDMTKPLASGIEVVFYKERLSHKTVLEAMCGSGRLLIPLQSHFYLNSHTFAHKPASPRQEIQPF